MERKVIFRDRQELQSTDLNNIQDFTDETLQHLIADAVTDQTMYIGLSVTPKTSVEVTVAPGRLYVGTTGKIYTLNEGQNINLLTYLPLRDKKYLLVVANGQEIETNIEPRDFLVDVQSGQTEPRAVAMEKDRVIVLSVVSGQESPDPQIPATPTGYLTLATILLDTSGIVAIYQNTAQCLPRLSNINLRVKEIDGWKSLTEPKLFTLSSDIASLSKKLDQMGRNNLLTEIAADVARLKELANLPDEYVSYGADHFLDDSETDTGNTELYALVEEGIRFPWAGQDESQLELFNPYESAVKNFNGFIIPDFTEQVRLELRDYAGDLSISQYQYQTFALKKGTISITRRRMGPIRTVCTNARHYSGNPRAYLENVLGLQNVEIIDVYGFHNNYYWIRYAEYWYDEVKVPYIYYAPETQQINGSQIAQTFLNSQHGWLYRIGLFFTQKDANGIVYLVLCETERGAPDPNKVIAITQLDPSDIKLYPQETIFTFPHPVFLEAGKRYALLLITAGNHRVAVASGKEYTAGTLFYSMDGEYYQGDLTKDLMMKLYYCTFKSTFVVFNLQSASLSGGIADIDIKCNAIQPENTNLIFEFQYAGKWYPVDEGAEKLIGLPALLPLRVKMVGSTTLMPALQLQGSVLRVSRPATSFVHISKERTLTTASQRVDVQLLLQNFNEAKHNCSIKLIIGENTYNPDLVEDRYDPEGIRRVAHFTSIPQTTSYKIRIEGTTMTPLEVFHVAERIDIAF